MLNNDFRTAMDNAQREGRYMVAPLVGLPSLNMTDCTIKLAQQNYAEHFKALKAIADTFEPDVIFPLMDLSVEANALGRYTIFPQEHSATVVKDRFSKEELAKADRVSISFDTRLRGYVETLKLMCIGLPEPMIKGAYVAGPYSLAALIMGAEEAAMATMLDPDDLHELCRFATNKIEQYIRLLIAAGTQVLCILEPSAVMLGPDQFAEFSANYVNHIVRSCGYTGVATVYHTCGNTMHLVDKMVEAGVDGVSLDSPDVGVDLPAVASSLPPNVAVMGNINPTGTILKGTPEAVETEVTDLLDRMQPYPNFVLSTGCDLPQETPLENIHAFMRAGRRYRR
jgi:uroporphyrinogen decarboxylase